MIPDTMQSDYSPLFFAAARGDLEEIRALAPESSLPDLNQALAQAAGLSHFEAAGLLIDFGADPAGTYSEDYGTVLFPSCEWMNLEAIRWLIERGADPASKTSKGKTALDHLLATHLRSSNKYRCIAALLKAGSPVNNDAVMAIHKGNRDALAEALDADPDALHRPLDLDYGLFPLRGATLLHLAAEYNELECLRELLNRGLDVNTPAAAHPNVPEGVWPTDLLSLGGQSALFHAAGYSKQALEFLLEQGADTKLRGTFERDGTKLQLTVEAFFLEVDQVESNRLNELELIRAW